jgi:hypothetical protein
MSEQQAAAVQAESMATLTKRAACRRARAFHAPAGGFRTSETSPAITRSVAIRSVIRYALAYQDKNRADIAYYLANRYRAGGFLNEEQKRQQVLADLARIMRYLREENRKPVFPPPADVTITAPDGTTFQKRVRVDAMFPCGKQADLVIYKSGKNPMTQTGKKGALERNLKLYAMVLYARTLGFSDITASLYYMRKAGDGTPAADPSFFGGGGNILSMSDIYQGVPNALDKQMAIDVQQYVDGFDPDEMDEEDCSICPYAALCSYQKPPIRAEQTD